MTHASTPTRTRRAASLITGGLIALTLTLVSAQSANAASSPRIVAKSVVTTGINGGTWR